MVDWFRKRREVTFERVESVDGTVRARPRYVGERIAPPLNVRVHRPAGVAGEPGATCVDFSWSGETQLDLDLMAGVLVDPAVEPQATGSSKGMSAASY